MKCKLQRSGIEGWLGPSSHWPTGLWLCFVIEIYRKRRCCVLVPNNHVCVSPLLMSTDYSKLSVPKLKAVLAKQGFKTSHLKTKAECLLALNSVPTIPPQVEYTQPSRRYCLYWTHPLEKRKFSEITPSVDDSPPVTPKMTKQAKKNQPKVFQTVAELIKAFDLIHAKFPKLFPKRKQAAKWVSDTNNTTNSFCRFQRL